MKAKIWCHFGDFPQRLVLIPQHIACDRLDNAECRAHYKEEQKQTTMILSTIFFLATPISEQYLTQLLAKAAVFNKHLAKGLA